MKRQTMHLHSDAEGNWLSTSAFDADDYEQMIEAMKAHYDQSTDEWLKYFADMAAYERFFEDLKAYGDRTAGELLEYFINIAAYGQFTLDIVDYHLPADEVPHVAYRYHEYVFDVSEIELGDYKLMYLGSISSRVEGRWNVAAYTVDPSIQMLMWTNDIPVDGHLFEYLTLGPIGLQVIGNYEGDNLMANQMSIKIETTEGHVILNGGSGGHNIHNKTFNLDWKTERPLNIADVTAIIINETRIPVSGKISFEE